MQKVCDVGRYLTVILVDCFADMRYYLTGKVAFNVITIMRHWTLIISSLDQVSEILLDVGLILQVEFYVCLYLCIYPN